MDNIVIAGFALTGILGAAAALVSLIVEVTKGVPPFKDIPTQLWCILVSLVICVTAYLGYADYMGWPVVWYYIACAMAVSFIVAYIAMYGWDTFKALIERFKNG